MSTQALMTRADFFAVHCAHSDPSNLKKFVSGDQRLNILTTQLLLQSSLYMYTAKLTGILFGEFDGSINSGRLRVGAAVLRERQTVILVIVQFH